MNDKLLFVPWGQMSLFTPLLMGTPCRWLFNGDTHCALPMTEEAKHLVPEGKYIVMVGTHPLVLRPTMLKENEVPEGHEFYHYEIGGVVYSGIFIGSEKDIMED